VTIRQVNFFLELIFQDCADEQTFDASTVRQVEGHAPAPRHRHEACSQRCSIEHMINQSFTWAFIDEVCPVARRIEKPWHFPMHLSIKCAFLHSLFPRSQKRNAKCQLPRVGQDSRLSPRYFFSFRRSDASRISVAKELLTLCKTVNS